ncbi:hypothetical protein HPP92_021887 [Vanilla planifolia]|uniref:ABC transporter domain-containing protein n=1 Tax=Vanilla planifolia TaxID=51239 RepID=A0A835PWA7_VANPL|nr:hypothetical protein HPP92_021887 [Vanilla planifolia]
MGSEDVDQSSFFTPKENANSTRFNHFSISPPTQRQKHAYHVFSPEPQLLQERQREREVQIWEGGGETGSSVMAEVESEKPGVAGLSPLSETLWREKTKTELLGDVSARLTWKELTVTVTLGRGETQRVLEDLTGYAEPGSFTALMGPSGSGKSTLLDALSSRLSTNAFLSGTILLNGRKTKLSFGTAAYVTQDDNLIGTLTVRETIMYSAGLRLPDKMEREKNGRWWKVSLSIWGSKNALTR